MVGHGSYNKEPQLRELHGIVVQGAAVMTGVTRSLP